MFRAEGAEDAEKRVHAETRSRGEEWMAASPPLLFLCDLCDLCAKHLSSSPPRLRVSA
jgi:hypothetical protein